MTITTLGQEAVIASTLTKREFTPLRNLKVVAVVATIGITAHLASIKIIRKLAGSTEIAFLHHLGLSLGMIGKSVLQGLQQGEITKQKVPEKLLTAIYQNQRMKGIS
jgi:hypothetical protein